MPTTKQKKIQNTLLTKRSRCGIMNLQKGNRIALVFKTEETAWDTPQAEKSKEGVMTIPA
jgi:hypothetical protein